MLEALLSDLTSSEDQDQDLLKTIRNSSEDENQDLKAEMILNANYSPF